jgi:phosphatidylserine/phosphatidylglycerophosphate/cardiolipin synthase-like enzyme
MDSLDQLTDADLMALAAAIRAGRLQAPFSSVSIQRYCGLTQAATLAEQLQKYHQEGMFPRHMGLLAEAIVRARNRFPQPADIVDLVWTGPETAGVTNRDTAVVVRDLFGAAESEVLVAGFAVYQGREVFKRLAERMAERPALRVRFFLDVYRAQSDTTLAVDLLRRFAQRFQTQEWPGGRLPELYYDPRSLDLDAVKRSSLHAKCIVVDRRIALVTSANFTEAAQTRNIEVGALVRDERFAAQLAWHFEALADARLLQRLPSVDCDGHRSGEGPT